MNLIIAAAVALCVAIVCTTLIACVDRICIAFGNARYEEKKNSAPEDPYEDLKDNELPPSFDDIVAEIYNRLDEEDN